MNKRLSRILAIALGAAIVMTGMVAVAGKTTKPGKATKTITTSGTHRVKASGHSGKEHRLGAKDVYLHTVEWSERGDKPCWMNVGGTAYKNGDPDWRDYTADICTKHNSSYKKIWFTSPNDDLKRVISGVQVCTSEKKNSDDERLKGIRIFSSLIDTKTGKVQAENETEDFHRTNCETWHDAVKCPAGEIASALLINEGTSGKGHEAIVGIGLECSKVKVK